MTRTEIPAFEGKNNVTKIVADNGSISYLTQSTSFAAEAARLGACILNKFENATKHVFFLFNDQEVEVGRYYLGQKLQGKSADELVQLRHSLVFFNSWNAEEKTWVPCVGLSTQENLAVTGARFA